MARTVAYGGCLQLQRCNHEDCCDVFCCVMAVEMDFLICLCFMARDFLLSSHQILHDG